MPELISQLSPQNPGYNLQNLIFVILNLTTPPPHKVQTNKAVQHGQNWLMQSLRP
jgi:hypothetical protein